MSANKKEAPIVDAAVRFDNLPARGRALEVKSTPEQRARMTERLNIESVEAFSAHLDLLPIRGGIQVKGYLDAEITQLCVVTFVPVHQNIHEEMQRIFLHGDESGEVAAPGVEVFVDLEGDDLPDYFGGQEVDFTDFLMEHLALAIDPYPRAPDAALPDMAAEAPEESTSPFASLKHLKSTRD
ncbi:YceD family protein [Mariluticola halotolerans]|uniref:YceD family protein n=1 Tax=Mariluticola halotolerans TaxID=2909283 RepID=UPI0026E1A26E|nr:DUF177 domain-containing protein [Mariluticola halotolerans]UJQ95646.1 DUF177 domain-containing protein [Mariluticola halotolerans]